MSLAIVRRGTALGLALVLLVAGTAFADELKADADVLAGIQNSLDLGEVAPGSLHDVAVDFRLLCKSSSHLTAGSTLAIDETSRDIPAGGDLAVTAGEVGVPADWPLDGSFCSGSESPAAVTPARLLITAPTLVGQDYTYTVLFGLPDGEATSNMIAVTVFLDVVIPEQPADTTAPAIHDLPADIAVETTSSGAVVQWAAVTAIDDTDPDPVVGCAPASGSTFTLGTTTVTCTAVDASGNSASATFTVSVTRAGPALVGTWGRPLEASVPALMGRAGRTIPLKLAIAAGGSTQGPADIATPSLLVQTLAACAADATPVSMQVGGTFTWADGSWQVNLDTPGLGTGCQRVIARVDGETVAIAVVQLVGDGPTATKGRR
ncbi:MAG TPA: HYR domain-containing protein [Candidatus Limnocylindrales bacterium]|nr:HYR domain-containing protein [Candidatus Limnocylindrales bacterium]